MAGGVASRARVLTEGCLDKSDDPFRITMPCMSGRRLLIVCVLVTCAGLAGCNPYRSSRYSCVSREPGLRGEVMRAADGKLLYFNGDCWTARPLPPTDTPF